MNRTWRFIVLLFAVFSLLAQYGAGIILGTVTDSSNAVVPGATVTVKNNGTGETRTLTTDQSGDFRFNAVPVGTYVVTATGPGFKTAEVSNLVVDVNTQSRTDFTMQVGAVSETLQVSATASLLQTDTASLGTAITNRTVLELPLNARNFFDLVALTPGAVKVAGGSSVMDGRSVQVGGIRNTSTSSMLDGADFTVANVFNPAIALSLDALQEFKVQVNFMDASYGHGAASVELVTKSGSNQFHGVAYDFDRNRAFNAGPFFRPKSGPPRFTYNQFGVNLGGPIRKDKTFFFVNYEGRRDSTGDILQGLIPTPQMLAGDFSATGKTIKDPFNANTPFPGNVIPANRFDPLAKQLLQYFPTADIQRPGANFLVTPSDIERRDQITGRVDHRFNEKQTLFGRYSYANDDLGNAAYTKGLGVIRPDRTHFLVLGFTDIATPNLISETRASFTRAFLARESDGDRTSANYASQLGIKNLAAQPGDYTLPNVNLSGYAPGAPAASSGFVGYGTHIVQNNLYYRLSETVTWTKGAHTIKAGADVNRLMVGYDQGQNQNGTFNFSGTFTGDSFADYLLGIPLSVTGGLGSLGNFGGVAKYAIGTQYDAFIQDDWKVTDRLTLNLGLRYEIFQQWRGRLAEFDLGTGRQLLAGSATYFVPGQGLVNGTGAPLLPERPLATDPNDFGPRLGLAYRLDGKTTIRTGAGVFYALNTGGTVIEPMMSAAPYYVTANITSSSTTPQLFLSQLFPSASQTTASVGTNIDLKKRDGYVYQYNLSLQRELGLGMLVEGGYIGNTAQKQIGPVFVNQPTLPTNPASAAPFSARDPYPALPPTFTQVGNLQWSNYNAGYAKIEQRLKGGISYIFSYTYSKCLDSGTGNPGQNEYNRRIERAICDTDVRNNLTGSYVWDLPLGRGRRMDIRNPLVNGFLGGWELSGITAMIAGMPLNITTSGDLAEVGTGNQRASATGSPVGKLNPRTTGLLGFVTDAYAAPALGSFGNLSRNTQPGFGLNNWDMGINKNFAIPKIGESGRLQVRAEFFNIWNHTQFNGIGTVANQKATFGIVNSTLTPRILQLAAKIYF
jgi:Carboxypeptidase regulatory-like domain/TonB dependent receptor